MADLTVTVTAGLAVFAVLLVEPIANQRYARHPMRPTDDKRGLRRRRAGVRPV